MKRFFKPVLNHPVISIVLVVLLTCAAVIPVRENFRMETDLNEYMPADHPAFVYSKEAEERFGIRDGILIAIEHPDSVFNPGSLGKITAIGNALRDIPELAGVRIQSLYTGDNIVGSDEGLEVMPFYTDPPADEAEAFRIGELVRENPMVNGRLISADGTSALIVAELPATGFSQDLYRQVTNIAASFEGPEKVYVAGRPIVEGTLAELGPKDMLLMGPLVLVVIALVLMLVLKSFIKMFTTVFIVAASVIWSFSLMTLAGIPVYSVSIMIPVMLVAIGVAYAIHVYNSIHHFAREQPDLDRREIVGTAIASVGTPSLFAALTTIAGFISLLTSSVYPVKYFGLFTAFGVASSWLLTMILVPAVSMLTGIAAGQNKRVKDATRTNATSFAASFTRFVQRHARLISVSTAVVVVLSLFGISRVWINASFLSNFEKDSPIVKTDAFVNSRFGGTSTINIILDSESDDAFKNPDLLRLTADMQDSLAAHPSVGDSFSLTTYLEQLHYAMNGDNPAFRTMPDSPELVAQYILLYEMSGDPENLWKVTDTDFRSLNITVQIKGDDSKTISAVLEIAKNYSGRFEDLGVQMHFAGSGYKSLVFSELILTGQLQSLGVSVLIVLVLVTCMFRNMLLGMLASIPVLLSMAVNFGIMGLLGIPLTISTALISSIAVGIGIDYSIHLINHYTHALKDSGDESHAAWYAMAITGKAVFLNAMIVISGFLVLLFSAFPPNRQVGALVSLNMLVAFGATVTCMFILLRKLYAGKSHVQEEHEPVL